jgi:beta-galactosidase
MPIRPWADPELTASHRLPMHGVPHLDRIELDGRWRFQLLPRPEAEPTEAWAEANVPGCWTMQGFDDRPHYTNVQMPFAGDPPEPPADNPTGVYERDFEVDAAWLSGRRVVLHVGAAESVLIASVNGSEVGIGKDSHLASEFDVTACLRPGTNTLRLRVVKWSDASFIEDQDQWWHGGITRSVFLYATARVHLADVRADASLADDLRTGTLALTVDVDFDGLPPAAGWAVEARLGENEALVGPVPCARLETGPRVGRADSEPLSRHYFQLVAKLVSGGELTAQERADWEAGAELLRPPLEGRVSLRTEIPEVARWSAEQPNLYPLTVVLRSPTGEAVERVELRVGFRRVEIRGLDLLINGARVLIRGVNRHDFDPATGRVISAESMRADIVAMKQFGFNAVRTSHYPNDPFFLDLCDELGLYVFDEADIESHAFIDRLCDDPRYLAAWLARVARMARRDKNHACVIVWSLGNESGHGANHDAAAGWLRHYDPSRPLHYEGAIRWDWAGDQRVSDLTCPMYPPIASLVAHAASGRQRHPLIMCEYSHAMGNSNGTLAEYWEAIESTPGLQGGFIWEWFDHGLVQKLADGTTRWAYGGDFGDRPNDGNFCLDGLLWPDRQPKPALFEHRQLAAPVRVTADPAAAREGELEIRNRQHFTDLGWLRAAWELLADGEVVRRGELELPGVGPGERAPVRLPGWDVPAANGRELSLRILFRAAEARAWAPEGFDVCWAQLPIDPGRPELSRPYAQPIDGATVELDGEGLLVHPLLAAAPRLCLWRAPTDNDRIVGLASQWRDWGVDRLDRTVLGVAQDGDGLVVTAQERTSAGIVVGHEQRMRALADGGVLVHEIVRIPAELSDLARVGIAMEADPALGDVEWFGRGPVETYPDRRQGGWIARWRSTVARQYVPYIRPQENGGHSDTRWFELSDGTGRGLRLACDRPAQFSATHLRAADLATASHDVELKPAAQVIVHLDIAHRGLGTASCGPDTLTEYLVGAGTYEWSWALAPLAH